MKIKISNFMAYEEFQFYYKNKIVNICYGPKGTFSYNVVESNVVILCKEFNTLKELLDNMKIENIRFPELWNILE